MAGKFRGRKPVGRKPPVKGRRKFVRKKKTRFVPKKPISIGTEVLRLNLQKQAAVSLQHQAGTALLGPANSKIFLPAMWNQHTTQTDSAGTTYNLNGNFMKPVYSHTCRFRVSYNHITNHADNYQGLNLYCIQGLVMTTMDKVNAGHVYSTLADFETAVLTEIKKTVFESGGAGLSDPLDYVSKNRNIKILKNFQIKPRRNDMILNDHTLASAGKQLQLSFPPPNVITLTHPTPSRKTRVQKDSNAQAIPVNLWLPFTMFVCPQLTANSGHFAIEHSGRMYFTDN